MHHLIYHSNCADGFAAVTIARRALIAQGVPEAEISARRVNYTDANQMPLDGDSAPGDTITYLDYTPPEHVIRTIKTCMTDIQVTIIDHHEKAAPLHGYAIHDGTWLPTHSTPFTSFFRFNASGAALAWRHYRPAEEMPYAVELIQWRDLGMAFDPNLQDDPRTAASLNLHAYLFRCRTRSFDAWEHVINACENSLLVYECAIGARIRAIDRAIILAAVTNPHWLNFNGEEIPAVNGLDAGLISDACTELLRAYPTAPFAASWYMDPASGKAVYSLRSRRASTVNVSEIAARMAPPTQNSTGGGGHPKAAGFSTMTPVPFV